MDRTQLYQRLFTDFRVRFAGIKVKEIQDKCNEFWNEVKKESNLGFVVDNKVKSLQNESQNHSLTCFFNKNSQ